MAYEATGTHSLSFEQWEAEGEREELTREFLWAEHGEAICATAAAIRAMPKFLDREALIECAVENWNAGEAYDFILEALTDRVSA